MVTEPHFSKSPKKNSGIGLQELPSAISIQNDNERTLGHPQLAKKQRKKPAQTDQDFYGHHKTYTDSKPV